MKRKDDVKDQGLNKILNKISMQCFDKEKSECWL